MKELMPLETYNLDVTTTSKEIDIVFITLLWSLHRKTSVLKTEKVITKYVQYEIMLHLCPRKFKVKKLFTNTGQ